MTVTTLREHGVDVDADRPRLAGRPRARSRARDVVIEPDLSNAAPFLAAALVTGGRVTVRDWPEVTTQPGAQLDRILSAMGAEVARTPTGLQVTGGGTIRPLVADLGEVGELTPVLAALCALADGPSRLTGIGHLRGHETDRLQALDEVLTAVGARVEQLPDGLVIEPGPRRPALLDSYADHRMVHAGRRPRAGRSRACRPATRARSPRRCPTSSSAGTACSASLSGVVSAERPPVRQPLRRGRRPGPAQPPGLPAAHPHPAGARRRRPRAGRRRRPRADDGAGRGTRRRPGRRHHHAGARAGQARRRRRRPGPGRRRHQRPHRHLARIVTIEERATSLRRTADDTDPTERIVVANADLLVIVTAVTDPEPAYGFLDRCLVAAYAGGLEPLLCLTKTDLASPKPLLDRYAGLGLDAVAISRELPLDELLDRLAAADQRARRPVRCRQVDPGQPAGARTPSARPATSARSARAGTRRRRWCCSTCPQGGMVIDTPGIRRSGWRTSPPTTSSRPSTRSTRPRSTARRSAGTPPRTPSAPSTPGPPPVRPRGRSSSRRSGYCWARRPGRPRLLQGRSSDQVNGDCPRQPEQAGRAVRRRGTTHEDALPASSTRQAKGAVVPTKGVMPRRWRGPAVGRPPLRRTTLRAPSS